MKTQKLKGKIAIITGGAQGIGKATAEKFCKEGAIVIIWDINGEKGKESVQEFKKAKYKLVFQQVDTTNFDLVSSAASEVVAKFGKIDILINNAGITRDATILKMTMEQWQKAIDVNLTGVFNCTKVIAPFMVKNKFGRIINTSSLVGIYGDLGQANYAATKSGIVGITKVWSRELGRKGVTVNAVAPGFIETDLLKTIPGNIVKSITDKIHVGRLGSPDDIANAYLFLASSESSFISGTVLSVDGGYVP